MISENMKNKILNVFKNNKKIILLIFIGFLGIILIAFSEIKTNKSENDKTDITESESYSQEEYVSSLEERLTQLISAMQNTGTVKVMITLESTEENVYAVEESIKKDEKSSSYQSKFVIIDNKNTKEGVCLKVIEPKIKGVAVVCTGGGDPQVKQEITNTVCSLLGIGSNRVSVTKMK